MSNPIHTHRVNIGCGYPKDPYAPIRFVMGESFDATMTHTISAVPASEDGKTPEVPEKKVRVFSAEEIAAAVESGWLIDLAPMVSVISPPNATAGAPVTSSETMITPKVKKDTTP